MSFCNKCNANLGDKNYKFCPVCGNSLLQPVVQQPTQPVAPQYAQPVVQQPTQPTAPQYAQPVAQQPTPPAAPQYAQPVVQQPTQPAAPQYAQPVVQQPAQPAAPQYAQPVVQQPTQPAAPQYTQQPVQPTAPQYANPTAQPYGYGAYGNEAPGVYPAYSPMKPVLKMKWFKFLINFSLFCSAVLSIGAAIMIFIGQVYPNGLDSDFLDAVGGGSVVNEAIYNAYDGLFALDMAYGGALIVIAVFAVITRFMLSSHKKAGPVMLYVLYALNAVVTVVYAVFCGLIANGRSNLIYITNLYALEFDLFASTVSTAVINVIVAIVMIILNIVYFGKRKHLFNK